MHRTFQRDAFRLKLETARSLAHALNTKQMPVQETVKLSAEVLGLGPTFTIKIGIQNIGTNTGSASSAITDLALFFHWDDKYYDVRPPFLKVRAVNSCIWVRLKTFMFVFYMTSQVPFLVPGVEVHLVTKVESVSTSGLADVVKVIVIKKQQAQPLLVAVINMPPSEMTVL